MINWTTETRTLAQLSALMRPDNPRWSSESTAKALGKTLDAFGQPLPILVDAESIIDGHQRISAWMSQHGGGYEVEVKVSDTVFTRDMWERFVLAFHEGATGEWDFDELANTFDYDGLAAVFDEAHLDQLRHEIDFGMTLLGKGDGLPEPSDAEADVSRADELRDKWGVELGQMWRLPSRVDGQEHRIICGDCTDGDVVARVMGEEKADIMLTSPPYNSAIGGVKSDYYKPMDKPFYLDRKSDLKTEAEWVAFCDSVMNEFEKVSRGDDATIVWNVMYNANMRDGYGRQIFGNGHNYGVKETICWDKGRGYNITTKGILSRNWELVFVLSVGDKYTTNQKANEVRYNKWDISPQGEQVADTHNAVFPLAFAEKALDWFCPSGGICYEPFCGSGTTIIASENLSRQCRAAEISPSYVAVALQRYEDAFGITSDLIRESA